MSVFVDTSAIFAGLMRRDQFHEQAISIWSGLLEREETLITHSLVEVETVTLLQSRAGVEAVTAFAKVLLPKLRVIEVDRDERREALAELASQGRRELSLVDRVSFAAMRRRGIGHAFTFDRHFAQAGFELVGPDA